MIYFCVLTSLGKKQNGLHGGSSFIERALGRTEDKLVGMVAKLTFYYWFKITHSKADHIMV